ncbi:MAG: hypothetical protein HPY79_01475 [Bacteroidales bacterium]|nr:hypothetical protein [Bacteroidales bacterium]
MYTYLAFGFRISSEIELSKFLATSFEQADLYIKKKAASYDIEKPIIDKIHIKANKTAFELRTKFTQFFFDKTRQTLFTSFTNKHQFEQYLYGPIMAIICAYYNQIPIHASGVVYNDKSLLLLGNSGSGKSTLLYHFIQKHQARFFADDIVAVRKEQQLIKALPAFPDIKLWLDAIERYHASINKQVHPDINKYLINCHSFFNTQIQSPSTIFILQNHVTPNTFIEQIHGVKKFILLSKYIYRRNIVESMFRQNVFETLTTLANQTDIYIIHRSHSITSEKWDSFIMECLKLVK